MFWIDDLLENSDKIVNADIEIRIPSNVNIDKNNCTIYIFDGIVSATKQDSWISEIDNYWYKTYDIVHVKP